jgi:hypothetical protein
MSNRAGTINQGVALDTKLHLKENEYSCHSEQNAASLRISAAKNERFFATLRMTNNSRLIALWYDYWR